MADPRTDDSSSPRTTAATPQSGRRAAGAPESSTPSTYVGKRVARRTPSSTASPEAEPSTMTSATTGTETSAFPLPEALAEQAPSSPATTGASALLESAADRGGRAAQTDPDDHNDEADDDSVTTTILGQAKRALPGIPAMIGVAAVGVAAVGALAGTTSSTAASDTDTSTSPDASGALSDTGHSATGATSTDDSRDAERTPVVSRDLSRTDAADSRVAESTADDRQQALSQLAQRAEGQAKKLEADQWGLPIPAGQYHITNTFGMARSYYASTHTGLDFAAPSGTPIHAVAAGTVTSTGYEGAYGNQTIITLENGTEIWYCHQTSFAVSPGDQVSTGDVIGYVGSTGNVTGPHVHVEVRPGGGDPIDPATAFEHEGITP